MNLKNTKICDLHTHTVHSDGTLTTSELVEESLKAGLCAIALTDHNTVGGLLEIADAAEGTALEVALGVEFSCELNGIEFHVIGMFIDPSRFSEVLRCAAVIKSFPPPLTKRFRFS